MNKEKILVVGACGQLGNELTQRLVDIYQAENVIASDIKYPTSFSEQVNFELLNVLDRTKFIEFVVGNKFTQIYHLAAILSAAGERDPAHAWKLNVDGLINVLDAAVVGKVRKIFWPSSIAVFGPSTPRINTPQNTIMDPVTVYGISKQTGERWCAWYHLKHGVDVRSLRYPGLISYKTKPGGGTTDYAVEIFFEALSHKRYECFLKHDTFLPMMYIDDAIRATIEIMAASPEKIKIRSSYNLTAMSFSPAEIAAEIRKRIPEFEISYRPDFRQAIADSWPQSIDDSEAQHHWGWTPNFNLSTMSDDIINQLVGLVNV